MEVMNRTLVLHNFIEEDWKLIRPRYSTGPYIGGSEVPAIMGCGYTSGYTLMRQKLEMEEYPSFDDPNEDVYWIIKRGNDLEPVLIDDAAQLLGVDIHKPHCMIQHPVWSHMIADFDGITEDGWLIEVKTTTAQSKRDKVKMGEVPMDYLVQGAHYLHFPQFDDPNGRFKAKMDTGLIVGENKPYLMPAPYKGIRFVILHDWQRKPTILSRTMDDLWETMDLVKQKEELFISMFNNKELPPVDGSESTTESLKGAHEVGSKEMAPTPQIISIHTDYKEAKAKEKEYKEQASAARNQLQEMCGDDIKKITGICSFFEKESTSMKRLRQLLDQNGMSHLYHEAISKSTQFRVN